MRHSKWVVLRDLMIFQIKLVLDGMKDLILAPLSVTAAALDIFFPGEHVGHRFYAVMRVGERFDRWLSLFAAAEGAEGSTDGLFGVSRAGANTMLGKLEAMVLGHDEVAEVQTRRAA